MIGKNPTSVLNVITLAQKKGAELCIIEGSHNHDSSHKVNNIYNNTIIKTTWDPVLHVMAHIS